MDSAYSQASTTVSTGTTVSAGWIGAQAIMYNSEGAFCTQSPTSYNGSSTSIYDITTTRRCTNLSSGYFYSKGKAGCWNQSSGTYSWYYLTASPNVYLP